MIDEKEFARAIEKHFGGAIMSEYEWDVLNDVLDILADVPRLNTHADAVQAVLYQLQERFEKEEAAAFSKHTGLKEHGIWNKAIRILEEYMEG